MSGIQKRRQAACATREAFVALGLLADVVALGRLLVLVFLGFCPRAVGGLAIGNCWLGGLLPFGCDFLWRLLLSQPSGTADLGLLIVCRFPRGELRRRLRLDLGLSRGFFLGPHLWLEADLLAGFDCRLLDSEFLPACGGPFFLGARVGCNAGGLP